MNTVIYYMGNEADDILSSLGLLDDEKKIYNAVKVKLEGHFVKSRNIIYGHAKFNQKRTKASTHSSPCYIVYLSIVVAKASKTR